MKHSVTCACGHEIVVSISRKADTERRLNWWQDSGLCPECYERKRECDRERATEQAEKASSLLGLRPLDGTEKQVAWAETLRIEMFGAIFRIFERFVMLSPESEKILLDCLDSLRDEISAKWWIDSREHSPLRLLLERPQFTRELAIECRLLSEWDAIRRQRVEADIEKEREQIRRNKIGNTYLLVETLKSQSGADRIEAHVWRRGENRRVYLEIGDRKVVYQITDDRYNKAGTMSGRIDEFPEEQQAEIRKACEQLAAEWLEFRCAR